MAVLRPMTPADLHRLSLVNCDTFTETFAQAFYLKYLSSWQELCIAAEAPDGALLGYIIGKVEGEGQDWHGHVTALSVSPEARNCGLAGRLLGRLERVCRDTFKCLFMDLYARVSNTQAVSFYSKWGYRVYRTEKGYYSGVEDGVDMRKPFPVNDPQLICMLGAEETGDTSFSGAPRRHSGSPQSQQQQQQGKGRKKRSKR